jgi:energy-coupling factor transporter ATP-binding protein EcfA2
MSTTLVKQQFYHWIGSFDWNTLSIVDKKLLNLFISYFDEIYPLSTAHGRRANKIGELIQQKQMELTEIKPELQSTQLKDKTKAPRIAELKVGPFRGFTLPESFAFDKKYTFLYGPNGSGKSSFCDGLEYALLESIEEAQSKRYNANDYSKNVQKGYFTVPKVYTFIGENKVEIQPNPNVYRFAFVEKNRIDGFARIAATTESVQKDRIATLFGLDTFSEFVNSFTEVLDYRYLLLANDKEIGFNATKQKNEQSLLRIKAIDGELSAENENAVTLIEEVGKKDISDLISLKQFLVGEDGISGIINELQSKKTENVGDDLKTVHLESLLNSIPKIKQGRAFLKEKLDTLQNLSNQVNFQELYNAIASLAKDSTTDQSICPACKTPISNVVVNPFKNAETELENLGYIAILQSDIEQLSISICNIFQNVNTDIEKIIALATQTGKGDFTFSVFSKASLTVGPNISAWLTNIEAELSRIESSITRLNELRNAINNFNQLLESKRNIKSAVDADLQKNQRFKARCDTISTKIKILTEEKDKLENATTSFKNDNKALTEEIATINAIIAINKQFAGSYGRLIAHLKAYRDSLPLSFAEGLADKTRDYYNVINGHDPHFEQIIDLTLPVTTGQKIAVQFNGEKQFRDALLILSEGHIRVLGLSLLLAKAVGEDLGFVIFDDIVNAIDDDHRDGIAELLMNHPDFKDRQHILTCHGEYFISKLEHKLGAFSAGNEVKRYRFFPQESIEVRGIKVSIGDAKHYLLLAKEALAKDSRKEVSSRCRQAIEGISESLWTKLSNKANIKLEVELSKPGARAELWTVVRSLLKALKKISGTEELVLYFSTLFEDYMWCLLNKGAHEQGDLPEFEYKDVSELFKLVSKIEELARSLKIETICK